MNLPHSHVGVLVPDVAEAAEAFASALGVKFGPRQLASVPFDDGSGGADEFEVCFAYSLDGPPHWELLQADTGHPVHDPSLLGLHHIGLWASDLPSETQALAERGAPCRYCTLDPDGNAFTGLVELHESGCAFVEFVDDATREELEHFWKTGDVAGASAIAGAPPDPAVDRNGTRPASGRRASGGAAALPGGSVPNGCPGHIVVGVRDLVEARGRFNDTLGFRLGEVAPVHLETIAQGAGTCALHACVSEGGPPHVMLIEGKSGWLDVGTMHVAVPLGPRLRDGLERGGGAWPAFELDGHRIATVAPQALHGVPLALVKADQAFALEQHLAQLARMTPPAGEQGSSLR
jgi:catechol 2,3-dioxygenase-like lactoylglutathione lyase family enzyme